MMDCKHEPKCRIVDLPPSPGSERTEKEKWPVCLLSLYGGNAMYAIDITKSEAGPSVDSVGPWVGLQYKKDA